MTTDLQTPTPPPPPEVVATGIGCFILGMAVMAGGYWAYNWWFGPPTPPSKNGEAMLRLMANDSEWESYEDRERANPRWGVRCNRLSTKVQIENDWWFCEVFVGDLNATKRFTKLDIKLINTRAVEIREKAITKLLEDRNVTP